MLSEDPSVTTWRLAIARHQARQPAPPPRRHWWRDLVTETYHAARDARAHLRESGTHLDVAGGAHANVSAYQVEAAEFDQAHPPVTLAEVMRGLSHGRYAPDNLGAW